MPLTKDRLYSLIKKIKSDKEKASKEPVKLASIQEFHGWIAPNGERISIPYYETHSESANRILQRNPDPNEYYDAIQEMFKQGYTRISNRGRRFQSNPVIETASVNNPTIRNSILKYLSERPPNELIDINLHSDTNADLGSTSGEAMNKLSYYEPRRSARVKFSRPQYNEAISRAAARVHLSPTPKQKEAGNYRMGHVQIQGLNITIENPVGSIRRGKTWETTMKNHYGYIKCTESCADGDHIDVFIGKHPESAVVFIIDQNINDKFDEHKCMIGFISPKEAKEAYLDNYSAGWKGFSSIRPLTMDQFKQWITKGNTHKPIVNQVLTFDSKPVRLAKATPITPVQKPLPDWVPRETLGKEANTGFIANPDSKSWIAGLKYTPERGSEMMVKKGGKSYPYPGLNLAFFRRWIAAQSKGRWWWKNIGWPMMRQSGSKKNKQTKVQLSRFTGEIHPLLNFEADYPPELHPFSSYTLDEIMGWMQRHVHPNIRPEHLSALIGSLPLTNVMPSDEGPMDPSNPKSEPMNITFSTNPTGDAYTKFPRNYYNADRQIRSKFDTSDGLPSVHNDLISIGKHTNNIFRGVSGGLLLRQMRAAHELGIPKIEWMAAMDGRLIWPNIGANGRLRLHTVAGIPPQIYESAQRASNGNFGKTHQISDLFASPEAKEWYNANPVTHDAWVDTHPGSYSRLAIERHVGENAVRHGLEGPIPDNQMTEQLQPQPAPKPENNSPSNIQPREPTPFERAKILLSKLQRPIYHPAIEHLIATGSLHPDYFDEYFTS